MRNAECGIVILSEVERSGTKSKVIPLSRGNVAKRQKGCRPATGPQCGADTFVHCRRGAPMCAPAEYCGVFGRTHGSAPTPLATSH